MQELCFFAKQQLLCKEKTYQYMSNFIFKTHFISLNNFCFCFLVFFAKTIDFSFFGSGSSFFPTPFSLLISFFSFGKLDFRLGAFIFNPCCRVEHALLRSHLLRLRQIRLPVVLAGVYRRQWTWRTQKACSRL